MSEQTTKTQPRTFSEMLRAEIRGTQDEDAARSELALAKVEQAVELRQEAEMHGALGGLASIDNRLPYPFVQVGVGGIVGLLVGELIDGFAAPKVGGRVNMGNVIVKGIAVLGAAGPARRFLGNTGAMAFGAVLTVQVLTDILPVTEWAASLKKMLPKGSLGQTTMRQPHPGTPTSRDKIATWFGQ